MKDTLSALVVFELAMFAIMVLFLAFCGFFTFKHCFYIWRKKKRRRRDDSLESILDLLYNEDYYYLESTTPYLPENEDSGAEIDEKSRETAAGSTGDQACFDSAPSHGRQVKWNGPEKISIDKFKVCPQSVKSESRNILGVDEHSKPKLKRQIKFHLSASSESFASHDHEPTLLPLPVSPNPGQAEHLDEQISADKGRHSPREGEQSSSSHHHRSSPESKQLHKQTSISIKKVVATSKFIGSAHRATKKMRKQSRFPPGTFRYRSDDHDEGSENSPQGSLDKKPLLKSQSVDVRLPSKRKVNFLEHANLASHSARTRHHKAETAEGREKGDRKLPSQRSAFSWFPRPQFSDENFTVRPTEEKRNAGADVEELCQEYERMEKTQYAEMLKKTKSLRRENLPFFHRKHSRS